MPHHLMNLRNVPDDEAEDIVPCLTSTMCAYETPLSRWGISMGGFWCMMMTRPGGPGLCWTAIRLSAWPPGVGNIRPGVRGAKPAFGSSSANGRSLSWPL